MLSHKLISHEIAYSGRTSDLPGFGEGSESFQYRLKGVPVARKLIRMIIDRGEEFKLQAALRAPVPPLMALQLGRKLNTLSLSHTGNHLVMVSDRLNLRVIDLAGKKSYKIEIDDPKWRQRQAVSRLLWSPDGRFLAVLWKAREDGDREEGDPNINEVFIIDTLEMAPSQQASASQLEIDQDIYWANDGILVIRTMLDLLGGQGRRDLSRTIMLKNLVRYLNPIAGEETTEERLPSQLPAKFVPPPPALRPTVDQKSHELKVYQTGSEAEPLFTLPIEEGATVVRSLAAGRMLIINLENEGKTELRAYDLTPFLEAAD